MAGTRQVFISYRRGDSTPYAGRIHDRLADHFGDANVFIDIDAIEPGEDFGRHIEEAVASCAVMIAVIGDDWLTAADANGQRRLDDPDDFVRLEVQAALERDVRVIPVLVEGATVPSSMELPEPLAGLARRNALEMSDARWRHDMGRLVGTIEKVLAGLDPVAAITQSGAEAPADEPASPATGSADTVVGAPVRAGLESSPTASGAPPPPSAVGPPAAQPGAPAPVGPAPAQSPPPAPVGPAPAQSATTPPPIGAQATFTPPPQADGSRPIGLWIAIGVGVVGVLVIVLALIGIATGGSEQAGGDFPEPLEPLEQVLPGFARAVNSGDCRQTAQYRHSVERPSGADPGGPPLATECEELRQSYQPLAGLRVGESETWQIAAMVDGTAGNRSVAMIFALDADRRWRHVSDADRLGSGAAQVDTENPSPDLFDDRAEKFIAALRARDCRTAFHLLSPESPVVLDVDNDPGQGCSLLNQFLSSRGSFPGQVAGDRSVELVPLGRTESHAFYGMNFPRGTFWTLVVSNAPGNADPQRVRSHAPKAGIYGWY